jgi:DNA-binding NarL/FixJ family response regulator
VEEFFMQISDAPLNSSNEQLLQVLSSMLIQCNALQTIVDKKGSETPIDGDIRDGLKLLERMTREALYIVRSSNEDLLPTELSGSTLSEALSHLVEETAETLGISSRITFSGIDEQEHGDEYTLSNDALRVLYLIAQETLYQIQQHIGTRRLRLTLNYGPDDVQMSIEDDGLNPDLQPSLSEENIASIPPFAEAAPVSSLPIVNDLRYRIEHLGGSLQIDALEERGTRLSAHVPYSHGSQSVENTDHNNVPLIVSADRAVPLAPASSTTDEVIRILIVDSQKVTRAGLQRLLESYAGLQVIGQAADGVQAVSETLELGPRVVLMDAQLPNGQSLEALRQIKQLNLDTKVLLLSTQNREEYLYETLRAGADGYILKDIAPDELAQAVRTVARGEILIQPQLASKLLSRFGKRGNTPYESLTTRELEVLRLLARGLRNKEIAARLFVSERTVNFHLANIYQKLNVSGRTEALSKALEQGLITA